MNGVQQDVTDERLSNTIAFATGPLKGDAQWPIAP
jgi:hypothetical protein